MSRKTLNIITVFFLFVLSFISCSDKIIDNDQSGDIVLINGTNTTIYYKAIDEETVPIIDWGQSNNIDFENKLAPNKIGLISFEDVWGYKPNNNIILYYWQIIKTDNGKYEVSNSKHALLKHNQSAPILFKIQ